MKTLILNAIAAALLAATAGCSSMGTGPGMGMRSGMNAADCQRYMEEHHRRMTERAKERGAPAPADMGQGMCAGAQR